jgi:hypothetical protein
MLTVAIAAAAVGTAISVLVTRTSAQAAASSNTTLKTPWGEPDLQGIWTEEFDTPLQRSARYANQEVFTGAQRQELDRQRAAHYGDDPRQERGSAVDVGGAYNTAFLTIKRVGPRTSMIVDPPNGRVPPQTPEAQRAAAADREFFLALMQSTDACKNKEPVCAGGKQDPTPWPRFRAAAASRRQRRTPQPQRWAGGRWFGPLLRSGLPEFGSPFGGSFRRIADAGWHLDLLRREPGTGLAAQHRHERRSSPAGQHPAVVWRPRGHWEADTLVIDVTNFSPKTDVFGKREPAPGRALDAYQIKTPHTRS